MLLGGLAIQAGAVEVVIHGVKRFLRVWFPVRDYEQLTHGQRAAPDGHCINDATTKYVRFEPLRISKAPRLMKGETVVVSSVWRRDNGRSYYGFERNTVGAVRHVNSAHIAFNDAGPAEFVEVSVEEPTPANAKPRAGVIQALER